MAIKMRDRQPHEHYLRGRIVVLPRMFSRPGEIVRRQCAGSDGDGSPWPYTRQVPCKREVWMEIFSTPGWPPSSHYCSQHGGWTGWTVPTTRRWYA